MSKESEDIETRTAAELRAKRECGQERTDWRRAASMPLPDGSDPDDAMEEVDWATTELPPPRAARRD